MPTQVNFRQFINTIIIGVLFEVLLVIWLYCLGYVNISTILSEKTSAITVSLSLVFAFPLWRIVSNRVGYILESVINEEKYKTWHSKLWFYLWNYYVRLFFGIKYKVESSRVTVLKALSSNDATEFQKIVKAKIDENINSDISKFSNEDLLKLYEYISASLSFSPVFASLLSEQHNITLNFHARLAVLSNLAFWLSIHLYLYGNELNLYYPFNPYLTFSAIFFVLGRQFGERCQKAKVEGCWLRVVDFMSYLNEKGKKA